MRKSLLIHTIVFISTINLAMASITEFSQNNLKGIDAVTLPQYNVNADGESYITTIVDITLDNKVKPIAFYKGYSGTFYPFMGFNTEQFIPTWDSNSLIPLNIDTAFFYTPKNILYRNLDMLNQKYKLEITDIPESYSKYFQHHSDQKIVNEENYTTPNCQTLISNF